MGTGAAELGGGGRLSRRERASGRKALPVFAAMISVRTWRAASGRFSWICMRARPTADPVRKASAGWVVMIRRKRVWAAARSPLAASWFAWAKRAAEARGWEGKSRVNFS